MESELPESKNGNHLNPPSEVELLDERDPRPAATAMIRMIAAKIRMVKIAICVVGLTVCLA